MVAILETVNGFVWGIPALLLVVGAGIYFSIRTGFAQLRFFPLAAKALWGKLKSKHTSNGVSSYQALCTALAATVGTGNLAGVAGAIAIGGPGAVFWMWICGIFGMVTKYAEAALAVHYRVRSRDGQWIGGPMYMIEQGMGKRWRWLAGTYCAMGVMASFGVGNATQINTIIGGISSTVSLFGGSMRPWVGLAIGVGFAILVVGILSGGARRIGQTAEALVPAAAVFYILLCAVVLILRSDALGPAFRSVFAGAFSPSAVTGGAVGSFFITLRIGASRGVFTNEAGMGTASIAHASAEVSHPTEQGLMGIIEVFLDTIVICTMTALVILCSGVEISYGVDMGMVLTTQAFSAVLGSWISIPLNLALCCFAVATILGWGMYGMCCAEYLFGPAARKPLIAVQAVTAVLGAVIGTGEIWLLADTVNGLMTLPNLIMLIYLSPQLFMLTKNFTNRYGRCSAHGGTYENIYQRKPLRAVSYEKVPSLRSEGQEGGNKNLPSEYRSA